MKMTTTIKMTTATSDAPAEPTALPQDSGRVHHLRRLLGAVADGLDTVIDASKPYVDGLEHLPADGRFLLVGNHTRFGAAEILLIPYVVRRAIGTRVRPLADRGMSRFRGPQADLMAAFGGVIGTPDNARELMHADETILVFPGGGREMAKFHGEEYTLRWENRFGFARLAVENNYPIVTVGLVGGDDVYRSVTSRDGLWGRFSQAASRLVTGRTDMAMPLMHGVGPTLIPRPQRMYLRFGIPIDTSKPSAVSVEDWVKTIKARTQAELEETLSQLQQLRDTDPYRELAPWAWRSAVMPTVAT
jgi:1-acyl-sn-glycerol-3-phosphate acyltransferase